MAIGSEKVSLDRGRLSPLQHDRLTAFFAREDRFFLSGGAALAGFYLRHRETHDLDLFTLNDVLDDGVALLTEITRRFKSRTTCHRQVTSLPRNCASISVTL